MIDLLIFLLAPVSIILGIIFICIYLYIPSKNPQLSYSLNRIDSMSGLEFESYMAKLFRRLGYQVKQTPASGDYGADLIVYNENVHTAVQLKRYSGKVGVKAVQEVIASKAYYGATSCLVVTNSYFTPAAQKLASANCVILWDRNKLKNILYTLSKKENEKSNQPQTNYKSGLLITGVILLIFPFAYCTYDIANLPNEEAHRTHHTQSENNTIRQTSTTTTKVTYSEVHILSANSDSDYQSSHGNSFSIDNTIDGDYSTCWQDGQDGDAIGETLSFSFNQCNVNKIVIVNGNRRTDTSYENNNRLSDISITFILNNTAVQDVNMHLTDNKDQIEQEFILNEAVLCDEIKITIDGVYSGTLYSDTGISEIMIYCND